MHEADHDLSRSDMATIAQLMYDSSGVRLTDLKSALVKARLQRRLIAGGFETFAAYVEHLRRDPNGAERMAMVDLLTTNQTAFFREAEHFRFLAERVVPEALLRGTATIVGWSAGCATGEEPYSIAITLVESLRVHSGYSFELLATDVSRTALEAAARGVYPLERLGPVGPERLRRHFERGVGAAEGMARVKLATRQLIRFEHMNLVTPRRLPRPADFIWCRNTMMYFDRSARQRAMATLEANLAPHGYLFVAHAENLGGFDDRLVRLAPAIYARRSK